MDIERVVNSKFFKFFDWVWALFIFNVLTLCISLGVVTLLPAFCACLKSCKDYSEGSSSNLFKQYFVNFKYYFKKSFFIGLLELGILVVIGVSIFFYQMLLTSDTFKLNTVGIIYQIGYYIVCFFALVVVMVFSHMPMIVVYFNCRYFDNFRFAIFMTFKFLATTIIIILCWIADIVMAYLFIPIWFFIGFSLPIYLIYVFSRKIYWYLSTQTIKENDN